MNGALKLEDKAFLTKLAEKVKARRMTTPAIFFLEMMKPLNFIGSQAMIFFGPIISAFVKTDGYYRAAEIFENHNSIEFLLQEIERLDKDE
tara:strand:- start:123 stop:395 length:273 start_codon:yes stop_codon:yes gene_type:complete